MLDVETTEAPIFTPSAVEFNDFVNYLKLIGTATEEQGICIIRPPKEWRPTFVLDLHDKFICLRDEKLDAAEEKLSILEFGDIADEMKMDFFGKPADMVTSYEIEKTFWKHYPGEKEANMTPAKITKIVDKSGFPSGDLLDLLSEDRKYLDSSWNLNNVNNLSLMTFLSSNRYAQTNRKSKLQICFSNGGWSVNDGFAYSLHYLHWGDRVSWYCLPKLSESILRTMWNGEQLRVTEENLKHSKVVTHLVQKSGEFVLVHPRSAVFSLSHGFNFLESISYFPYDWLEDGYSYWKLCHGGLPNFFPFPFSYEELLFKFLRRLDGIGSQVVKVACRLLSDLVSGELEIRRSFMKDHPGTNELRRIFELDLEDPRRCKVCRNVCFLSAILCHSCKMVSCLRHYNDCNVNKRHYCCCVDTDDSRTPASITLLFRYTESEMMEKLVTVTSRVKSQEEWIGKARRFLSDDGGYKEERLTIKEMEEFKVEGSRLKVEDQELIESLEMAVRESQMLVHRANEVLFQQSRSERNRLTLDDLKELGESLKLSKCKLNELENIQRAIKEAKEFSGKVKELVSSSHTSVSPWQQSSPQPASSSSLPTVVDTFSRINELLETSSNLLVKVPEIDLLKKLSEKRDWILTSHSLMSSTTTTTIDQLHKLIAQGSRFAEQGGLLEVVIKEVVVSVQGCVDRLKEMDGKMKKYVDSKTPHSFKEIESLIEESSGYPKVNFPNLPPLRKILSEACDWMKHVDDIMSADYSPYLHNVKSLLLKGRSIPVVMETFSQLEADVKTSEEWLERLSDVFLRKERSNEELIEILAPKMNLLEVKSCKKTVKKKRIQMLLSLFSKDDLKAGDMDDVLKSAVAREMEDVLILQKLNKDKCLMEESRYCLCKQPKSEGMIECRLCKELYHDSCIIAFNDTKPLSPFSFSLTPSLLNLSPTASSVCDVPRTCPSETPGYSLPTNHLSPLVGSGRDTTKRFLCSVCCRSKRPRLEQVLPLLVTLQNLPLRIAEGQLLESLIERSMAWTKKVTQFLTSDNCRFAVSQLAAAIDGDQTLGVPKGVMISTEIADTQPPGGMYGQPVEHAYANKSDSFIDQRHHFSPSSKQHLSTTSSPTSLSSPRLDHLVYIFNQLESFSTEADLMEVTSQECKYLDEILSAYYRYREQVEKKRQMRLAEESIFESAASTSSSTSSLSMTTSSTNVSSFAMMQNCDSSQEATPRKRKRKCMDRLLPDDYFEDDDQLKKNIKKTKYATTPRQQQQRRKNNNLSTKSHPLKKTTSTKVEKGRRSSLSKSRRFKLAKIICDDDDSDGGADDDNSDSSSGDDGGGEDCSAELCLKPLGKEVDWVQCDRCSLWFHLNCIGIRKEDISEDDEFECKACSERSTGS